MQISGDGSKALIDPVEPDLVDPEGQVSIEGEQVDTRALQEFFSRQKNRPTIYNGGGVKTFDIDINAEKRAALPDDQKDSLPVVNETVTRDWFDRYTANEGLSRTDVNSQYSWGEKAEAFFETENSLYSQYVESDTDFGYDRNYDPLSSVEVQSNPELQYLVIDSNSDAETKGIIANFERESRNREIINQTSFWGSLGFSAMAMTLDPVMLPAMLFTGGQAFTAVAGARGVALATAGVVGTNEIIAEMIKHDSQQLRTPEETFVNVAAATLLGGLFGAAGAKLTLRQQAKVREAADKLAKEFVGPPSPPIVYPVKKQKVGEGGKGGKGGKATTNKDSAGAARADDDRYFKNVPDDDRAQLVSTGTGLEKMPINPLVRMSMSQLPLVRYMGVALANTPYYYKGFTEGKTITGGQLSIEQRKHHYIAKHTQVFGKINEIYLKHRGEGATKSLVKDITGQTEKGGQQTYRQFQQELGRALRSEEVSDNPAIVESVAAVRADLLNPIMEDAIGAEIFDEGIRKFAQTYFPRLYDFDKLKKEADETPNGFVMRVLEHFKEERAGARMELSKRAASKDSEIDELERVTKDYNEALKEFEADNDTAKFLKEILRWDIDLNDAEQIRQALKLKRRPLSLAAWVRSEGGLKPDSEAFARDLDKGMVGLTNKNGKDAEWLIQRAVEEGYYNTPNYNEISFDRFLDDLMEDNSGNKIYTSDIEEAIHGNLQAIDSDSYFREAIDDLGLSRKSTLGEIRQAYLDKGKFKVTKEDLDLKNAQVKEQSKKVTGAVNYWESTTSLSKASDQELLEYSKMTKQNILNENVDQWVEDVLPDVTAFKAGNFKDRKLHMDDAKIADYLIDDAQDVLDFYTKAVSPQIAMKQTFGSIDLKEPMEMIVSQYNALKDAKDAELRAAGASEKKIAKAQDKIEAEKDQALKDVKALRDKLYGKYNRPNDPDSFWIKAGETVKAYNYTRMLGGMTIAAISDLARPVMVVGLAPTLSTLMALRGQPEIKNAAMAEIKATGAALDSISTNMSNRMSDVTVYTGKRTRFQRGLETTENIFSKLTLMPQWNDAMKGFTGLTIQNEMARAIKSSNMTPRQVRELAKQGIGTKEVGYLRRFLDEYGEDGDIYVPNSDKWRDIEVTTFENGLEFRETVSAVAMQELWRGAIGKTINQAIVTPEIGEMPLWVSSPTASVIMQFKSFIISAHSKVLISGLQARDQEFVQGMLLAVGLGALINEIKAAQNGSETPDNVGDYIYGAVDRAGILGWLNEPIQMASKFSRGAINPARLWGSDGVNVDRYQSRNVLGTVIGPTGDLLGDLASTTGAITNMDYSEGDVSATRKLLPMQNLFYFAMLLQALEK